MRTLTALLWMMSLALVAQPTTEEEYNYMTTGYHIQAEHGLGMKAGYRAEAVGEWVMKVGFNQRKVAGTAFYRDGQDRPCGLVLTYVNLDKPKRGMMVWCIPTHDAPTELWDRTWAAIQEQDGTSDPSMRYQLYQATAWGLAHMLSREASR